MAGASVPLEPGTRPVVQDEIEFNPPLGSVPDFTFSHPVLRGATDRWQKGGGGQRLVEMLKDGENIRSFHVLVRTTAAMFAVPMCVMAVTYLFVLDRVFVFSNPADKMLYAGMCARLASASAHVHLCARMAASASPWRA